MALVVTAISKSFGRRKVLSEVSLNVEPGEIVGLLGANGAGKSTLFSIVLGLLEADGGFLSLDGRPLDGLPIHQRIWAGLGYLPQDDSILRLLTVEQNLCVAGQIRMLPTQRLRARVSQLLDEFGLGAVRNSRAIHLSGGEQRRLEIARCLLVEPAYMLLDEPFTGIDPVASSDLGDRIRALAAKGIGILVTDHNLPEILPLLDRGYILAESRLVAQGSRRELARSDAARQHYLGERYADLFLST